MADILYKDIKKKMKINITVLERIDIENIIGALPYDAICEPIKKDNKLHKKYSAGFSPQKTPIKNLIKMYCTEININNVISEFFYKAILTYINSKNLFDLFVNINIQEKENDLTLEVCIEFGVKIAEANCEIPPSVILKLISVKDKDSRYEAADFNYKFINNYLKYSGKKYKNLEKQAEIKEHEYVTKINFIEKENNRYFKEVEKLRSEIIVNQEQFNIKNDKVNVLEEERNTGLKITIGLKKENDFFTNKFNKQNEFNNQMIKQLEESKKELTEYVGKYDKLRLLYLESNEKKILEFEKAMMKLLKDVIDDLKNDKYPMNEVFKNLEENFDENEEIRDYWGKLSEKEKIYIDDISALMQINAIKAEDINKLDEVENSLIFKYIFIKSLKTLFFEYLSINECSKQINSVFNSQ